jgi:hypothetical protein
MVMDGDREHPLGMTLADHIVVQNLADFLGGRNPVPGLDDGRLVLLTDNVHAELDALIADEHGRAGNKLPHLMLALAAEGAIQRILGVAAASLVHTRPD